MNTETPTAEQLKTVHITLGGKTRGVVCKRISEHHVWQNANPGDAVIVRFRTGKKTHKINYYCVCERNGEAFVSVQGFRNANRCFPVAWADDVAGTSKWG